MAWLTRAGVLWHIDIARGRTVRTAEQADRPDVFVEDAGLFYERLELSRASGGVMGWPLTADTSDADAPELAEALAVAKSSSRLPVDTEGMRRHLYTQIRFDRLQDYEAWARVGGLLTESYLPTAQRSALFRAAATISGVVAVKESQDAAGRKGIAAAMVSPPGVREEDVFDPETYDYLGRRGRSGRERGVVECPVERQRRRQCTTCAVDGPGIRPASCATLPTSSDLRGTPGRWPV
ncbi:hypothetical protein [Nonomuraea sp. NPDC050202]|uniref:hypothetical protein n=1 Tax=Nonomuraea sp. NPDC050202 TaxID=3155035 RepID=UPI0033E2D0BB